MFICFHWNNLCEYLTLHWLSRIINYRRSISFWFSNYSSNLQINLKEKSTKGNNSFKNLFLKLRKGFLDHYKRDVTYLFKSSSGYDKLGGQSERQTDKTKNLAIYRQIFSLNFCLCPISLFAKKELDSYLLWFLRTCSSNLQRNHKEI